MKNSMHTRRNGLRVVAHARQGSLTALAPAGNRASFRVAYYRPRRRRALPEAFIRALRFGRNLLLAVWAFAVLALFVLVFADFVWR